MTDRLELLTELAQLVVLALVYLQFALRERRDALHDAEVIARLELLAGAVSHTHGAVLDLPAPPPRPLRTPTPVTLDLTQPEPTRPGTTQLIRSDVLEAARREATPTPRRGTL
ncbi:MAG: hypothetical protein WKG00_03420 [Polyangiaceae bacterium]